MEAVAAVDKSVVPPSTVTNKELEIGSKVNQIADQIVTLNLLEVAQLSEVLKKRLNLPDAPLVATSSLNLAPKIEVRAISFFRNYCEIKNIFTSNNIILGRRAGAASSAKCIHH